MSKITQNLTPTLEWVNVVIAKQLSQLEDSLLAINSRYQSWALVDPALQPIWKAMLEQFSQLVVAKVKIADRALVMLGGNDELLADFTTSAEYRAIQAEMRKYAENPSGPILDPMDLPSYTGDDPVADEIFRALVKTDLDRIMGVHNGLIHRIKDAGNLLGRWISVFPTAEQAEAHQILQGAIRGWLDELYRVDWLRVPEPDGSITTDWATEELLLIRNFRETGMPLDLAINMAELLMVGTNVLDQQERQEVSAQLAQPGANPAEIIRTALQSHKQKHQDQ